MSRLELKEHLELEFDHYIPSDAEEIYWDFYSFYPRDSDGTRTMMTVLLVAVKKEAVHRRVELIRRAGLYPVVVDLDILALRNLYAF